MSFVSHVKEYVKQDPEFDDDRTISESGGENISLD